MSEKIIQRYSLDLAKDQYVKAGDYVTLSPHCVMTHGKVTGSKLWVKDWEADGYRQLLANCDEVYVNWGQEDT